MESMVLIVLETSCGHPTIILSLDTSEVAEISDPWCTDITQL